MARMTSAEEDALCVCEHALYLHDDGVDACLDCDCRRFVAAKPEAQHG